MPFYQRLGDVPRKRHVQFRENGTLLTEEVMGLEGFTGNESILYHLQSPCRVMRLDGFEPIERKEWVPDQHAHRHFKTFDIKPDSHTHDMYSLADPVHGLKVGAHHAGPEVDPSEKGEPEPRLIEQIANWTRETYRLAEPDPVAAGTCLYTTTLDETFILERRGRLVIGSPCSGHGFKFAPAIGERLADLATG